MQTHRSINTLTSILRRAWLVVAVIFSLLLPVTGTAQDKPTVSLRFANGQDSISGPLVDFKDEKFFIEASIGLVAIPTNGVICVGEACPEGTRLGVCAGDRGWRAAHCSGHGQLCGSGLFAAGV